MFIEKLTVSPLHVFPDERDALYGICSLTAFLRARLKPAFAKAATPCNDPVITADWSKDPRVAGAARAQHGLPRYSLDCLVRR
jgi:hypothetical protein